MAKPFRALWDKMSPEAQAAAARQLQAMLAALPPQALPQAPSPAQAPARSDPQAPQQTAKSHKEG